MDRRTFLGVSLAAGASVALPAAAAAVPVFGGPAFGSYWRVALGQAADQTAISHAIARVVARIDNAMSPYRDSTEISRLNTTDSMDWQTTSPDLTAVLDAALDVARQTDGAFDPTVGGIVGRYGFGPIKAVSTGDVGDLFLRDGALRRARPGIAIDLCGIAKGRALDLIGVDLATLGVTDAMIELGGEVLALGQHPDGRPWRVAVETPETGLTQALELAGLTIATSGDRPQGYRIGGTRYGHVIDPRRGAPATGDLISASVIDATAMRADALATALFALGAEDAGAMADTLGLDTILLVRDGAGIKTLTTGQTARLLL